MVAVLNISDGTTTINLIGSVFRLVEDPRWRPQTPQYKGGGVWQNSPLADGRQLAQTRYDNIIDSWTLHVFSSSQDDVIYSLQELRRLLTKSVEYWTTDWQNEPVWIEARATCESNTRYAIIKSFQMPEDDDPYQTPFLGASPGVAMNDIQLIIEHGIWTETPPGVGTPAEINNLQEWCPVTPLWFDGIDDDVNFGSPAVTDNLHDAAFTVEAWINPQKSGVIAGKRYWYFRYNASGTLSGFIDCAVADGIQVTTTTVPRNAWAHVAMTWDDATYLRPRIWINGVEAVYNAGAGSNRNGAVILDAAENLLVGEYFGGVNNFQGNIGWMRISNNIRYAAPFTPPTRCVLPNADANTVFVGICEGVDVTAFDHSGNAVDGNINGAVWDSDEACCEDYGHTDTTANEVYITNHNRNAQLTHVFYYDASVPSYSANLLGAALPYALFPAVPAVGDICYFGMDTSLFRDVSASTMPISLIFDLVAQTGITGIVWEAYNGAAWVAVNVTDYTNAGGLMSGVAFDTAGVNSVAKAIDSGITSGDVNGSSCAWLRARITGVGGAPTPPIQQNRDVYVASNAFVDFGQDSIAGDISAISKIKIIDVGDRDGSGGSVPNLYQTRCICGLRSVDRGPDFVNMLFAAGKQNPGGIVVTYGALTSSISSYLSLSGSAAHYLNNVAPTSLADRAIITLNSSLYEQFAGRYRVFLRNVTLWNETAAATTYSIRLRASSLSGGESQYSDTQYVSVNAATTVSNLTYDLGIIVIPKFIVPGDQAQIAVQVADNYAAGAGNVHCYIDTIALVPVDEWAGDFYANTLDTDAWLQFGKSLVIDSIGSEKMAMTSYLLNSSNQVSAFYQIVANGNSILQANKAQRLWFLFLRDPTTLGTFETPYESLYKVQVERQQRYLSMRGAR